MQYSVYVAYKSYTARSLMMVLAKKWFSQMVANGSRKKTPRLPPSIQTRQPYQKKTSSLLLQTYTTKDAT